jgi:hypothetical protein
MFSSYSLIQKVPKRGHRLLWMVVLAILMTAPLAGATTVGNGEAAGEAADEWRSGEPLATWEQLDSFSALVEVPPLDTKLLKVDYGNLTLVPVEWYDPLQDLSQLHDQAVDRVEPWLQRDLAVQLNRMGSNGDRYARLIVNCPEADWVDEIAFSVAHTPTEVLTRVGNANVLQDNAKQLYEQDADIAYADIVDRTGEDGEYSTVSYLNYTGVRHEYPRDIYYWYIAHARVFWEDPARVAGKSFWRKAYWDEITYNTSGTLKSWLIGANNIIEAANVSTIWMQMNMEFGYGTNPLQPVQVILERYGSCGQFSITTASSLKAAMIPARIAIYPASDHQWCEVYIDGHWMHVDASNDVAGKANVKEPHLIRRTNSVNFNDAGVFERGWKPFMSATSTFRSDDVITNTIGISAPDPSFSFRESGMTERTGAEPHNYTETSKVTITVKDSGGDPLEGAYVGIFRVGHDIYNPGTPDYPHFANANYTNATGQVEFQLGLQGYCGRCDADHYYAALVLSRYNEGTNDFYAFSVPEENQEHSFTYTVTGDAPSQTEPAFEPYLNWPPTGPGGSLDIEIEAWGKQRHTHGEYGQAEMFGFRTSFDHIFPSDVDVAVLTSDELENFYSGQAVKTFFHRRDVQRLKTNSSFVFTEDSYLLLSNTDSHYTTKVVNVTVNMTAQCWPRLNITGPDMETDHNTDAPLVVNGTLWDYIPITGFEYSLDEGETWMDVEVDIDIVNKSFEARLDVSSLVSGDHAITLRATNSVGVWRVDHIGLFFDAEDPDLVVDIPNVNQFVSYFVGRIWIFVNASDNRELTDVQARLKGFDWQDMGPSSWLRDTHEINISNEGRVGPEVVEVRAIDGVGRTTIRSVPIYIDGVMPIMELTSPEPSSTAVVGQDDMLEVTGSVWDDQGISILGYKIDDENGSTSVIDTLDGDGHFTFQIPSSDLEPGEHEIMVYTYDLAMQAASKYFTLEVDATPPSLLIHEMDAIYQDGDDVDVTGTVSDPHGLGGLWIEIDYGGEQELAYDIAGGFQTSLPSGPIALGGHRVTVRAIDSVGNEVVWTVEYQVVDETLPIVNIGSPYMGSNLARGKVIRLAGSASDNVAVDTLTLKVGDDDVISIKDHLDLRIDFWSLHVGTVGRTLGPLSIEVWVVDTVGNSASEKVIIYLVDGTEPTASLQVDPMDEPRVEKGRILIIPAVFADDVGVAKVEYRVDGWSWIPVPCPLPYDSWDVEVPSENLATGRHLMELRVTDSAGNEVIVTTVFVVEPVPKEDSISTSLILGIVVAVVVGLVLIYFLVKREYGGDVSDTGEETEAGHEDEEVVEGPESTEGGAEAEEELAEE